MVCGRASMLLFDTLSRNSVGQYLIGRLEGHAMECLARHRLSALKRGFTLIEILVVIAVLGVLASILYPVFAGLRESARSAGCQCNLKQIGLAVLMYAQDHDDML